MIIKDINAKFIVLTPSIEDEGLVYDFINITGNYNDVASVSKTLEIPATPTWTVFDVPISSMVTINQIYIKNVLTNTEFGLLDVPFTPFTAFSVNTLKGLITTKLLTLGFVGVTQATTVHSAENTFDYSILNLPYHLTVDRIEYIAVADAYTKYFSTASSTDLIYNDGDVIITPAFFSLDAFVEGIYKFVFTGHQTTGNSVLRQGCYFLDITLKCRLTVPTDTSCGGDRATINYLMMHYSLVAGSNCNCECTDLYNIYDYLNTHLPLDPNTEDCGC